MVYPHTYFIVPGNLNIPDKCSNIRC